MAEVDWSALKPLPNFFETYDVAFQKGRQLAIQRASDQALQTYAVDPDAGLNAMRRIDPERAAALLTQRQSQQDRDANIDSASRYAQGDVSGALEARARTGDTAGVSALQTEAINRHMAQLQFAQSEAAKVYAAGHGITDPAARKAAILAAFDAEVPNYQQFAGTDAEHVAQIRQHLEADPDATLRALMAAPHYSYHPVGDNTVMMTDDTTGDQVGWYVGTKFIPYTAGQGVLAVGGDGVGGGQGGGQSGGPPPPPAPPRTGGAGAPISVRQNNPGNLRDLPSGQHWNGQTGTANGFAVFDSPEAGARAAEQNLIAKQTRHGLTNLTQIIGDPHWGWAPAADHNDPAAYAARVAQAVGVDPNQPLDLVHDAGLRQRVLRAMFDVESGGTPHPAAAPAGAPEGAMAAATGGFSGAGGPGGQEPAPAAPAAPAAGPGAPAQPGGPGVRVVMPATPAFGEPVRLAGAPGSWQRGADGQYHQLQGSGYEPTQIVNLRDHVTSDESYKQAKAGLSAYHAMIANADTMTGPSAYAMLDTFARAINPGAVARPTVIQTIEDHVGLPAKLVGSLSNMTGQGNLAPEVRQQILDAVLSFVQSHWDHANELNQSNAEFAQRNNIDPRDVTAPLEGRPTRYVVGSASQAAGPRAARPHGGLTAQQVETAKRLTGGHSNAASGSVQNPFTPVNEAEYNGLPSGAHYIFTDGRVMVKP